MTKWFLVVLNMSIAATYVTLAVIAARFLLRRAPKIFSYILWSAVAIRLVIPVHFTSNFSLFRWVQAQFRTQADTGFLEFVPQDMGLWMKHPVVHAGMSEVSRFVQSSLPGATPMLNANPLQIILWIASVLWIAGAAVLLLYSVYSYRQTAVKVRTATLVKDNIFETDQINTPFVFGFWRPRIYIPTGLREPEFTCILLHEQTHIRRRDYWIKLFAFLLLIVHWFNPLMWLSYALMTRDMEMSCDERVVGRMGDRSKGSYAAALLSFAASRSGLVSGSPLSFGETDVKARIQHILAYRRPAAWKAAGSMLVIAVLIVGCTTNPEPLLPSPQSSSEQTHAGYRIDTLMENKTLYVGNASKVGGLISGLPKPSGFEGKGIELQTKAQPYGLTIRYSMHDSSDVLQDGAISGEMFYRHAVVLFSLIDNVNIITFSIADNTGQYDGATYRFTFTRDKVSQSFGEDVRKYAADETSLRKLIDQLESLSLKQPAQTV